MGKKYYLVKTETKVGDTSYYHYDTVIEKYKEESVFHLVKRAEKALNRGSQRVCDMVEYLSKREAEDVLEAYNKRLSSQGLNSEVLNQNYLE